MNPTEPTAPAPDVVDPPPVRPSEPDAADCCGEGCVRCVYDVHEEALERYQAALAAWQVRHPEPVAQGRIMWIAVTREVSPALGHCELSYVPREAIDVARATVQQHQYRHALQVLGCRLLSLPAEPELPDSVFVEDVAIVLDEVAVLTRPGALSRRGEVASVAEDAARYRPLLAIEAPGTLDGGDVLRVGRTLYVGESARSNAAGIMQLRELLAGHGYAVHGVPTQACLHLKSAVTQLDDEHLVAAVGMGGSRPVRRFPRDRGRPRRTARRQRAAHR